jgi:hypothetical protein
MKVYTLDVDSGDRDPHHLPHVEQFRRRPQDADLQRHPPRRRLRAPAPPESVSRLEQQIHRGRRRGYVRRHHRPDEW